MEERMSEKYEKLKGKIYYDCLRKKLPKELTITKGEIFQIIQATIDCKDINFSKTWFHSTKLAVVES